MGPAFQDDTEIVTAAVQGDGLCLFVASNRLRQDRDLALAAVRRDREALAAVLEPLRRDPKFLCEAYWASSLDYKAEQRLSEHVLGTCETWEELLGKRHGRFQHVFWSALHKQLREG